MIDWQNPDHQCALAWLAHTGKIEKRKQIALLIVFLEGEHWIALTTRQRVYAVTEFGRTQLDIILKSRWPEYAKDIESILRDYDAFNSKTLAASRKQASIVHQNLNLPPVINRKTFAAAVLTHSKSIVTDTTASLYSHVKLVVDHPLVMRTNAGLVLRVGELQYDCDSQMAFMGVVFLSERTALGDLRLCGAQPKAVITVENPATFHDMPLPEDFLAILVEGWNTTLAGRFLRLIDSQTPLIHFSDFDPNGFAIYNHLAELTGRPVRHFLPDFASEYISTHALDLSEEGAGWNRELLSREKNPSSLLAELIHQNKWMEQECITLDPRLSLALQSAAS